MELSRPHWGLVDAYENALAIKLRSYGDSKGFNFES
jgi:hypothetical protein